MLVGHRRECDLVPALAGGKTAIVEIAAGAGFGKAEERHGARGLAAVVAR